MLKRTVKLARPELVRDGMFIAGEWRKAASAFAVIDPASCVEIARVPDGTVADAKDAIKAAKTAFKTYSTTTARHRSDILKRWAALIRENVEDLGKIVTWENGKPTAEAQGEILSCAQNFEWFAEEIPHTHGDTISSQNPGVRIMTIRQPVGVCGIITPWNFPGNMIARKVAAALAAGCTTVIKPASETPLTALALVFLGQEAGIPSGVLNIVTSESHTKAIGAELSESPLVSKVTFTGSTPTGKILMSQAASTIKKVSFELGGNAPFIVFDDADIDKAVQGALASKFRGSGQTCVCANRFFVQAKIYDEFVTKFSAEVKKLVPGHGLDNGTTQGPLINDKSIAKVKQHVDDALGAGEGRLVEGGKPLPDLGPHYFAPTVVADVNPETARVFREETFGPLAAIAKFDSDEQVVQWANSTEVGLAGYFYSKDITRIYKVSEALEVGMVGVNTGLISEVALPFGGVKESGFGREGSVYGLDDYTVIKTVAVNIN